MNFLQLGQELVREAAISGTLTSVSNQTGEMLRVVNWIQKAYKDIQNRHVNWDFLRADISFQVSPGVAVYSPAGAGLADFGEWRLPSFRIYASAIGFSDEQPLDIVSDWDTFRDTYLMGTQRTQTGRPIKLVQKPDQSLQLWTVPDQLYTVVGEYCRTPATMAANADIPIFPAKYHDAIVWRALMFYGAYENDAGAYANGEREFSTLLSEMEHTQLPQISLAGGMV